MMKRNVNKFTLATLVLAFLVVVPAVAAQIEEGQSVVCRDVNGEIEWIIGIPGESRPVDQFNWGVTGDTPVVLNGQAGVVREVGSNLKWFIKGSPAFCWGLTAKGDTPVVLNGQAGVVREVKDQAFFMDFVAAVFSQRRKKLSSIVVKSVFFWPLLIVP